MRYDGIAFTHGHLWTTVSTSRTLFRVIQLKQLWNCLKICMHFTFSQNKFHKQYGRNIWKIVWKDLKWCVILQFRSLDQEIPQVNTNSEEWAITRSCFKRTDRSHKSSARSSSSQHYVTVGRGSSRCEMQSDRLYNARRFKSTCKDFYLVSKSIDQLERCCGGRVLV